MSLHAHMSSKKLARVRTLPPDAVARLRQHDILTCKDFLSRNPLELMNTLSLTLPQIQALSVSVSRAVAPKPQTVLSMHEARRRSGSAFLPTSLHKLDTALHGGLAAGTITEIAGPPGSGKTQFCLMLCVIATLPSSLGGLGVKVAYIDTEAAFTAERLVEIAKARYVEHFSSVENLVQLAGSVHVFSELTCDSFTQRLKRLDEVIAGQGIGLIVIDSIASLVRKEFDTRSGKGVAERAALLTTQAARIKYLAEAFTIPVLVTNQITTQVSRDRLKESDLLEEGIQSDGGVMTAALGNTWSHCVNTRLLLQYHEGGRRLLTVAKSPLCGYESFVVNVEEKGLVLDWMATGELQTHLVQGDPTAISLVARSSTENGLGLQFAGVY